MIAFVVPIVMLGIACAVSTGDPIVWENAYLGAALIFFLVMISNSLNNIVDEKIDIAARDMGLEKSHSYHILNLTDGLTRDEILSVIVLSIFCFGFLLFVLSIRTGYPVIGFALFGLFMSLEYNLPPLKLAYRPFPELTMLLPSAVVAVTGIQYILVSHVTELGIIMGITFGLFSGSWFVYQSIIDHDVDKAAGKVTTAVYVGPVGAVVIAIMYPPCAAVLMVTYEIVGIDVMWQLPHITAVSAVVLVASIAFCGFNAHKLWQRAMLVTFVFGIAMALSILNGAWLG
ncbi:MAG: prenyltransferase [candidate division Zixibacteria bacterium]|nr:prenyltransferase [candidate division Zixibacteria bacterium]